MTDEQLSELERLSREANPAPWESEYCAECDGWHMEGPQNIGGTGVLVRLRDGEQQIEDVKLIVAMRNAIDYFIEEAKAARVEVARLQERVKELEAQTQDAKE